MRRAAEERRLQRIQSEIEELREALLHAQSKAGSVVDRINEIDLKIALLGREADALEARSRTAAMAYESARRKARRIRAELDASEIQMRRWLQELYKSGPTRFLEIVVSASSPAEVAAAQRAVETLSLLETERLQRLRADRAELEAALDELAGTQQRLEHLRDELAARETELRSTRTSKTALLERMRGEQESQSSLLRELVQVETEIRAMLRALRDPQAGEALPSRGFERYRGLLMRPVPGRLLVPFGNVRHPRFRTEVPHPGIDLAADPGREVQAVFDGRVVFSDWFRGYGQLIVLDHGDGYLSIYGRLGERLVDAGQEVQEGQAIARSGEAGALETPGLYFEIRHDGEAEDPLPWLRQSQGRVGEGAGAAR